MGFFSSLVKTMVYSAIDAYNDEDDNNYRRRGLENTPSNNGWYKCVKCGKSYRASDMDVDHILPKSCGGGNNRENLQCICKHCNRSKGADTSETMADLARRKKELKQQDKEDMKYIKEVLKSNRGK